MSGKTNKAFKKRIKTSNPQTSKEEKRKPKRKVRKKGKTHFNAKESGEKKQQKRRMQDFDMKQKDESRFLPHDQ